MTDLIYAKGKNQRISPRKARLIVGIIKGNNADEMSQKLMFVNKKAAGIVKKVLDSALSNAKNKNYDPKTLIIKEARVDEGFTFKRGKPVARGRYHRIIRRNSNIIIGLGEKEESQEEKKKTAKEKKTSKNKTKEVKK